MKPSQALQQDWHMYYHDTWMVHATLGYCQIHARRGVLFALPLNTEDWVKVKAKDLDVWWPRPGAYNTETSATYIIRKPYRCMKRSAVSNTHYVSIFGHTRGDPLRVIAEQRLLSSWKFAKRDMDTGRCRARAITRDLIVKSVPYKDDEYSVIFRGEKHGRLVRGHYIPDKERHPSTKLILNTCYKGGIIA